ncbi:thioesterase family protein [bacterium]|nr:thioesterase family protein [bacterium]
MNQPSSDTGTSQVYHFPVQIYYEDTDHSGVVYHANYLKYFERAREHVIGSDRLVALWKEKGLGYVVYKADLTYSEGVEFGESLDIRTTYRLEGEYRLIWRHEAWRQGARKAAVTCDLQLVCVDADKKLKPIPSKGFE